MTQLDYEPKRPKPGSPWDWPFLLRVVVYGTLFALLVYLALKVWFGIVINQQ